MEHIDQAAEVRKGESFDLNRVESFLRDNLPGLEGEFRLLQFPKGHSDLTYLVQIGARELVLRRPPFGTKAATAHDMVREYRILTTLENIYPYAPAAVALCEDESLIGGPRFERVMQWLGEHISQDSEQPGIIHNDFKLDNIVLDPQDPLKVIGVLDWEMATLGDPLMDLGCSLAYWVQPDDPAEMQAIRFIPTHLPGALTREQMAAYYGQLAGKSIDKIDFYLVFGVFRLAAIAQQIYYRYYHGQTSDQRFKTFVAAVHILDRAAKHFIERAGY